MVHCLSPRGRALAAVVTGRTEGFWRVERDVRTCVCVIWNELVVVVVVVVRFPIRVCVQGDAARVVWSFI